MSLHLAYRGEWQDLMYGSLGFGALGQKLQFQLQSKVENVRLIRGRSGCKIIIPQKQLSKSSSLRT
jgi:hypothetical protein